MFINKTEEGMNNRCGDNIRRRRKAMGLSQRQLADRLQIGGLDIDKNAVQRIEAGKRFVIDIELVHFSRALDISVEELLFAFEKNTK